MYEIDLHGITMAEAKMVLDEVFVYVFEDIDIKKVRIVVGKGNGSEYGPVLPAYVANYIQEKGIPYVIEHGVVIVSVR